MYEVKLELLVFFTINGSSRKYCLSLTHESVNKPQPFFRCLQYADFPRKPGDPLRSKNSSKKKSRDQKSYKHISNAINQLMNDVTKNRRTCRVREPPRFIVPDPCLLV